MNFWKNLVQILARYKKDGFRNGCKYIKRRSIAKLKDLPHTIVFESSSVCNLRCSFCYILKAPIDKGKKFLSLETFKKVIEETQHFLQEVMLHWRGEPLLNKDLPEMVLFTSERDIKSSFSTNGLLLKRSISKSLIYNGLDKITISLDGTTPDIYELHRCGGNLGLLLENINELVNLKMKTHSRYPRIELQMIVTKENQHQIEDFELLAKKLGVDGALLMSLFIDRTADVGFVKRMEEEFFVDKNAEEGLSRYFIDDKGSIELYNLDTLCPQDAKYPLITCDGDLIGCCYDIFLKNRFGNCNEKSFISLWNEKKYIDFRRKIMMLRKLVICKNCMPKNREWTHRLF